MPHRGIRGRDQRASDSQATARRNHRRCRTGRGDRVTIHPEGTLSQEQQRQECKEARLLVQSVTSETSSCSGSPNSGVDLTPDLDIAAS
ncbi:hypothetical protein NDU88_005250 [Pleurodeles waltl]|uniref:Uncharacterized protein n=1 Tax=Pleurodeles waltl TaxID=8319 RepID=A0AAV7M9Z0_PLEWA|nr:hypothetical protein NDU88_005250 [Pleurodeles waltl]